mmetsp:Transcript_36093/g.56497  ORF Transcript_36093/g.56497 Transcript_36093/m.56497 type:complete len:697 (-) Transcript_36093:316-2406(-)
MAKLESPQRFLGITRHRSGPRALRTEDLVCSAILGFSKQLVLGTFLDTSATTFRFITHGSESHTIIGTHRVETGRRSTIQPKMDWVRVKSTRIVEVKTSEIATSSFSLPSTSSVGDVGTVTLIVTISHSGASSSLRTSFRGATRSSNLQRSSKARRRKATDNRSTITTRTRGLGVHRTVSFISRHVKDVVGIINHTRGRKSKNEMLQVVKLGPSNLLELVGVGKLVGIIELETGTSGRVGQTLEIIVPGFLAETQVGIKIRINSDITGDGGATQGRVRLTAVQRGANVNLDVSEGPARFEIFLERHDGHIIVATSGKEHGLHTETHVTGKVFISGRLGSFVIPTKLFSPVFHDAHIFVVITRPKNVRVLPVTHNIIVQGTIRRIINITISSDSGVENTKITVAIDKLGVTSESITTGRVHDVDHTTLLVIRSNKLHSHIGKLGGTSFFNPTIKVVGITKRNEAMSIVTRVNATHTRNQIIDTTFVKARIVLTIVQTTVNIGGIFHPKFKIGIFCHLQNDIREFEPTLVRSDHFIMFLSGFLGTADISKSTRSGVVDRVNKISVRGSTIIGGINIDINVSQRGISRVRKTLEGLFVERFRTTRSLDILSQSDSKLVIIPIPGNAKTVIRKRIDIRFLQVGITPRSISNGKDRPIPVPRTRSNPKSVIVGRRGTSHPNTTTITIISRTRSNISTSILR